MNQTPQNVNTLKKSNRAAILECVRRQLISRVDISRKTGLTKSAVTMLTNEMIAEGILYERSLSLRGKSMGRTSVLLDIVSDYAYAIGVALHRRHIRVCVTDLRMNQLARKEQLTETFSSPDEAIFWIADAIRKVLESQKIPMEKCVGIGISSPGPLDYANGVILNPPHFPLFEKYPVIEKLGAMFPCPVYLENNSVSLAIADDYLRCEPLKNSLFIVALDGIGSALMQEGKVFRGAKGFAGELGHISIDPQGPVCSCGNHGCLEHYATMKAMKKQFGFEDYTRIADGTAEKDPRCTEIMDALTRYFGEALVSCVNLFDLDSIVLFGEYGYRSEELTGRIEAFLSEHSMICRVHPVSVIPARLSADAMDTASAIAALNGFFTQGP